MNLQHFVTDVIESFGGIVEPVEYALCHALIPQEYKGYFQNKTELVLAFDYEVAQENPDAEFVTFGSYVLEQALAIIHEKAVSTIRFAEIDRRTLANPLKKLTIFLQDDPGKIRIEKESQITGAWIAFQFLLTFISDEKEKRTAQVWVNLITGEIADSMQQMQNSIMYTDKPLYPYPIPQQLPMDDAFKSAYQHMKTITNKQLEERQQDPQLAKDLTRIETYYEELIRENNRKAMRRNVSKEKKAEIATKSQAIVTEMHKQLTEIKQKYHGSVDISLNHTITYFIPMLAYDVEIDHRANKKYETIYYNFITKQFEREVK